ncbi:MAG TPA: hypothetical protein VLE20_07800 [Blastocatellia bacterium]|nr:hypothetical protein [Blastocatellia bacterium]
MSKIVRAFVTLMFVALSAYSQTPGQSRCTLTEATSPNVRGLRLGMSTDQLLALFPGSTKRKEITEALAKAKTATSSEPLYLSLDPARDAVKDHFAGVDSVSAGLLNGRVVDFGAVYVGAAWTIDAWVAKLSESFGLPPLSAWVPGPSESPNRVLTCDGVVIEAATQGGSASIRIRNTEALKGNEDQVNAAQEKRRRETKP